MSDYNNYGGSNGNGGSENTGAGNSSAGSYSSGNSYSNGSNYNNSGSYSGGSTYGNSSSGSYGGYGNGSYGNGSSGSGSNGYGSYGSYGYGYEQTPKKKKERKPHPILKKGGKVVAAGLVFGLVASLMFTGTNYVTEQVTGKKTVESAKSLTKSSSTVGNMTTGSGTTSVTDVSGVVDNAMPAIVQVTNVSLDIYQGWFGQMIPKESTSAGSGIIISQDDNYIYIATNNHVVEGARELTVTFCDDKAVSAEVQGTYEASDLAVVKVAVKDIDSSTLDAIKVATMGTSDSVKVGESAIVIGNAMGYGQSVTTGVISALNRDVQVQSETTGQTVTYSGLLQTDAAVNPGNSGGALLNTKGEVIGIVSAKLVDTTAEGLGYAIPITKAESILTQLMNGQKVTEPEEGADGSKGKSSSQTAYLGIYGVDIDSGMAASYKMPQGVYVAEVIEGGGAEKAGITKRDIITKIEGTSVSTMSELQDKLKSYKPGDTVKITVAQYSVNYQTQDITVTLGEKTEETASDDQ